jgi:mannose-6-phosphate isomerase-like protein (cupin superfamily)
MRTCAAAALVIVVIGLSGAAQAPGAAVLVTAREMRTALDQAKPDAALSDLQMRVIDIGGQNVGAAIVRRTRAEVNALVHDRIAEVYVVQEGSGTIVTGGTLVNPTASAPSGVIGPSSRGTSIASGTSARVGAGDVVIIPPGTPHMFSQLEGNLVYVTVRFDPSRVLTLK